MINRIIASYLLFSCFIAIALKLGGVDEAIHLGNYFKSYLVQSNNELMNFKIAIPNIQEFKPISDSNPIVINNAWDAIRYAWATMVTSLHIEGLVNGIVNFLNGLITVLNTIIQTVELIFIFLKNLITMKNNIISA